MTSTTGPLHSSDGKEATLFQIGQPETQRLRDFHALHFPNQKIPDVHSGDAGAQEDHGSELEQPEDLGYYEDGVRRTLTDEQVRMFRHSEIQRLLLVRRQQREKEQQATEREQRQHARNLDRKRRFDDNAIQQHDNVDALMYDDTTPATRSHPTSAGKKFIWPKLGG